MRPFLVASSILVIDMVSKLFTHLNIPVMNQETLWFPFGGISVFHNLLGGINFSISHATNKGMAWGLLPQYQEVLLALRIICIIALALYVIFFNKTQSYTLPFSLVIAGAVGNILDYFFYGHVVDMFFFSFWGYSYPVFNIADASIFIGVFWLLGTSIFSSKHECDEMG